jgi:ABC-type sugar transport system ATPase subunit
VFLMDEPLSNLDAKLRVQTRGEIKKLQQAVGTTTVYVTHDQVEAMTMGDRIAVMNEGRLEQVGTPAELYEQPVNTFVAGFLGSPGMSFVPAERLGVEPADAVIGVRPEFARLWQDGMAGPFEGEVEYVEALGRETFLGVDGLVLQVEGRAAAQVGDTVRYGLVRDGLRRFDSQTGAALDR